MKPDKELKEMFFESARTYASASIFYTPVIIRWHRKELK
jgi:hypothetical protein